MNIVRNTKKNNGEVKCNDDAFLSPPPKIVIKLESEEEDDDDDDDDEEADENEHNEYYDNDETTTGDELVEEITLFQNLKKFITEVKEIYHARSNLIDIVKYDIRVHKTLITF